MEALRGIRTINEIAQENELAPTQVSQWKKELESRVSEIFVSKSETKNEGSVQNISHFCLAVI